MTALTLDVTDPESIAAARAIDARHGCLDILINNAGINLHDGTTQVSGQRLATWHAVFETNLFGLIAVTQAFLPLLRKSAAGRIVNLSSVLASMTLYSDPTSGIYDFKIPAYNVSKIAVNAWTVQLAYELRDTPADRNYKPPVRTKSAHLDALLLGVTSLMLRPSLEAPCLAWAIRAADAPPAGPPAID